MFSNVNCEKDRIIQTIIADYFTENHSYMELKL